MIKNCSLKSGIEFDKHRLPNFRYENLCCVWI